VESHSVFRFQLNLDVSLGKFSGFNWNWKKEEAIGFIGISRLKLLE